MINVKDLLPQLTHEKGDWSILDFESEYEFYDLLVHKSFEKYDMKKFDEKYGDDLKVYRIGNGIYENHGLTATYAVTFHDHLIFSFNTNYNGDKDFTFYKSGAVVFKNMFKLIEKFANVSYDDAFEKMHYCVHDMQTYEFFAVECATEMHSNDDSHYLYLDKNAVMRVIVKVDRVESTNWGTPIKLRVTYLDENGEHVVDELTDNYLNYAFMGFVYQDFETIKSKFANRFILDFSDQITNFGGRTIYSKKDI